MKMNPALSWDPPPVVRFPAVGQYVNLSTAGREKDPGVVRPRPHETWLVVWHLAHVGRKADLGSEDTVVVVRSFGGDRPCGMVFEVAVEDLVALTAEQRSVLL